MARLLSLVLAVALVGCAEDTPDASPADAVDMEADIAVVSNESDGGVLLPEAGGEVDTTGAASVTVEGQTVPTRAVVAEIESSDTACLVTLRTDGGGSETVHADYSLCDTDGLEGRRVQIDYAPSTVLAASCGGDPGCLDTETVALAVAADVID
ncbi:MAG: hypothetical protein AAF845_03980 [Bacteroidota bacterium]